MSGVRNYSDDLEERFQGKLAFLVERRKLIDQAIERRILIEERFGKDTDYEDGFVISADRVYGSDFGSREATTYTYVFLKVRNGYWVSTAQVGNLSGKRVTWSQLIDFLSECDTVHYVAKWEAL